MEGTLQAGQWRNNVWVVVQVDKVALSKTVLLKY
jgi:hypothetical protein